MASSPSAACTAAIPYNPHLPHIHLRAHLEESVTIFTRILHRGSTVVPIGNRMVAGIGTLLERTYILGNRILLRETIMSFSKALPIQVFP